MSTAPSIVQDAYIAQPVHANSDSHCLRPHTLRKDLGWNHPVDAADAKGEVTDVNPDKGSRGPSCPPVAGPGVLVHRIQSGHNELRDTHANGAHDEDRSATPAIHEQDRRNGTQEVENPDDPCGQEVHRAAGKANVLEDLGCIVNNRVDSC